jgi:hypothetical protein
VVLAPRTLASNRLCGCLSTALELPAQHDQRIQNKQAWDVGLAGLPDAQEARNVVLTDDGVRESVSVAYARACWPCRRASRRACRI